MGSKKKPTIGYWYKVLYHLGICRGPVDALLEFRGGDKTAWKGEQTASGIIAIDALNLWGGEKKEGGIQGDLHVMMGEAAQAPNAMLASTLGPEQSAYRGRVTMAYNGRYGAFNPYPKPPWFKLRRILKGWDDDVCWYPEKAAINIQLADLVLAPWLEEVDPRNGANTHQYRRGPGGWLWRDDIATAIADTVLDPLSAANYMGWSLDGRRLFQAYGDAPGAGELLFLHFNRKEVTHATYNYEQTMAVNVSGGVLCGNFLDSVPRVELGSGFFWWSGFDAALNDSFNPGVFAVTEVFDPSEGATYGNNCIGYGPAPSGYFPAARGWTDVTIQVRRKPTSDLLAMNPAHILYDSLTSADMKGEPVALINDASFRAAADLFYTEAFGLCTQYDAGSESVEQFQQRILNAVGANLSQSRTDGQYYLTPIRGVHDLGTLEILADDDILEYSEEPSDPLESVNQVAVEWFDQATRSKKTTTPLQALGAIQAVGAVLADTSQYPEIPSETLALRVGARDLNEKSQPRKRFTLTTTRVAYAWRAGQFFRLQAPRRGIADMVCMVGEIGAGVRRSGSIRLRAIQDVSSMPTTTYVTAEPGIDTSPSSTPTPPPAQGAFEAPYFELVGSIPTAELATLAADSGFIAAFAARPTAGVNFDLWTKTGAEEYEDRGDGDWCPYATIVEAADPTGLAFTLTGEKDLASVAVGQAAIWGNEIARVDAIDIALGTITLGRGCADTTPALHVAGQTVLFFDGFTASDAREYTDGEVVDAKMLSRTSSALSPIASAAASSVTMASRAARPYPPGKLRITDPVQTDAAYPPTAAAALTVSWAHRDRLLQEDQILDESAASVGPEAGTTYTVSYYLDGLLDAQETAIAGASAAPVTLSAAGEVRVEVKAVRDGLDSWQAATATFAYTILLSDARITDSLDTRTTDSGDRRITD